MPQRRRLLPEWAPQAGVLLAWPHEDTDWAPLLGAVEAEYRTLARTLAAYAPVLVLCRDEAHRAHVAAQLRDLPPGRLRLACCPYDDTWTRDYGPLAVAGPPAEGGGPGKGLELVDCRFDGWGGKHPAARDDAVTACLHAQGLFGDVPLRRAELVLEGGAVETDGRGTLLATRSSVLPRNPGLDRPALEAELRRLLGLERFHWLEHGHLEGDDTDGHVDTLARYCGPRTIAHAACDDPGDPHHGPLAAMAAELRRLRDPEGRPYRLVPLPWPRPIHAADGSRLPATYANFLILDRAVLVPAYGDPADEEARRRLAACFPGREVRPVPCRHLLEQRGSLHCATLQLPRGALGPG